MKRLFLLLTTVCICLGIKAQNPVFGKYADMEDLEYVCISSAMLRNLGKSSATINGIQINGITNALKNVLIINSKEASCRAQMKADFLSLRNNPDYELMMEMRDGSDHITTLAAVGEKVSELVMFIQEGNHESSFVVLNGNFSEEQLNKLIMNASK
ncbi:MAG: DUF4252 domain-containing protein [Bacteroidales bacterium]|nr:DUF4252 domain-containing protein [Bacteroidales bacterium]